MPRKKTEARYWGLWDTVREDWLLMGGRIVFYPSREMLAELLAGLTAQRVEIRPLPEPRTRKPATKRAAEVRV